MGKDFIYLESKPWKKSWDGNLDSLKQQDLFTLQIDSVDRHVQMQCFDDCSASIGAECRLEARDQFIDVFDGYRKIGVVASPPTIILAALAKSHGLGAAVVERLDTFGHLVDLRIL